MSTDRAGWFSLVSSAFTAVVVGFASTILLIMEAARAVDASPGQIRTAPMPLAPMQENKRPADFVSGCLCSNL